MSIPVYTIKSPLSQISSTQADAYLKSVEAALGEPLVSMEQDAFLQAPFALMFVASGGSEGYFVEMFDRLPDRPCYLLTSGDSNSLAASMEILAFLRQRGKVGEIIHGDIATVSARIRALSAAFAARQKLSGLRLGIIGKPSDWLIASSWDSAAYKEKLGAEIVEIPMSELLDAYAKKPACSGKWAEHFLSLGYDRTEMDKALTVYAALKHLIAKHRLTAVTVRCFDLLGTVFTTGCLALSILNAEGIPAGCEGDVPAAMSMAILNAVSGKPVFLCNPSRINPKAGNMVLAHCTLPADMPYDMQLTTHYESGIGVAIAGSITEGECTVFKASGDLGRFYAKAGRIQTNLREPTLCRTQIQVALDDFSYFLNEPIQNHHLVCAGDHTAALTEFFAQLR